MENESFWERFRCEILTPLKLWLLRSQERYNVNKIRASYGLPIYSNPIERLKNTLFLIDTFFGLEVYKRLQNDIYSRSLFILYS